LSSFLAVSLCWISSGCAGDEAAPAPAAAIRSIPATTPAPRTDFLFRLRHRQNLTRAKQGNIDLLFLGDSITQRWDQEVWKRYYGKRKAANFGIDGDRTEHVLWRLANGEIEGISPKVLVLLIGINNGGRDSAADIAEGIRAIVTVLRRDLPNTKILLLGVFPVGPRPGPHRDMVKAINAIISKLDNGKTVRFLDIGDKFLERDGDLPREIMPDYLHLSRKGYTIWARAMEPLLEEML
jgi:lysophospholipase L1-like esterase